MLNATFEMYTLHCIKEHVGNLCSPRPLHKQQKIYIIFSCSRLLYVCFIWLTVPLDINLSVARVHSASDLHIHSKARE